jgi:hypothetical protein
MLEPTVTSAGKHILQKCKLLDAAHALHKWVPDHQILKMGHVDRAMNIFANTTGYFHSFIASHDLSGKL